MAARLVRAIKMTIKSPVSSEQLARAEQYAGRLDSLPGAAARELIEAHAVLNSYYRAVDIDPMIIRHSTKIIELGRDLQPEEQRASSGQLVAAYRNASEAYASLEQPETALRLLDRAPGDLPGVPDVRKQLQVHKDRYSLIGRPAAPIV
jgi:hypothetical protein